MNWPWMPYGFSLWIALLWRTFKLRWLPHREYPFLDGEIGGERVSNHIQGVLGLYSTGVAFMTLWLYFLDESKERASVKLLMSCFMAFVIVTIVSALVTCLFWSLDKL